MLVALLSCLEPAEDGATCPRAFLQLAGRTVIRWQAGLALELGCERIICLANGLPPELVEVQHRVERAGRRFHVVTGRQALHGLIAGADEIIALADGVLPDRALLFELTGDRAGVVTMPAEQGLAAGFERLDRDDTWAGLVRCSGSDLERLADLPPDIDPLSALMRSALQAGRPRLALSAALLFEGRWLLIRSSSQAREAGQRFSTARLQPSRWVAPANAVIDRLIKARAEVLLRRVDTLGWLTGGTIVAMVAAVLLGISGYLAAALAMLTAGSALDRARLSLALLQSDPGEASGKMARGSVMGVGLDLAALGVVGGALDTAGLVSGVFAVAMLLGITRLATVLNQGNLARAVDDRIALFGAMAIAAAYGYLVPAVQIAALFVLAALLLEAGRDRLTGA